MGLPGGWPDFDTDDGRGEMIRLLYSRKDAAYQLSISLRQVDTLIANRHLGTRRVGGRVLIPHGELTRFAGKDHYNLDQKRELSRG